MRKSGAEQIIGRIIANKFAIESLLGSGAMGAVYRARQIALEKTVAIKVLHGEHADDATFAARFHREAKAASRLNHPNSMQVIDFGQEPDGLLYIAMEYLDGRNLHRILKEESPLPPPRIADILMQTLAALAVAHDMGVVHRDLKPENIMVLQGTDDDGNPTDVVKVCDFGIAKITDNRSYRADGERESQGPVTTAGFLVGTPEYMSPEQGRGEKLDARSDLYSVGVILYQMLTGVCPFEAENAIGVVLKHITEDAPLPSFIKPRCDVRLESVCVRAMRKQREHRYQSAREMRADLRMAIDGGRGTPRMGSRPDDLPSVQVRTAHGAPPSVNAATIEMQGMPAHAQDARSAADVGGPVKPTLAGTASAIPGLPRRRRLVALVGALALFAVVAWVTQSKRASPQALRDSVSPASSSLANAPVAVPDPTGTGGPPDPTSLPSGASSVAAVGSRGKLLPMASSSAVAAHPSASVTPSAEPPPSTTASAALPPPPASTAAPPPPDPFDVERAYVVVGLVSVTGAKESGVRAALRGVNLSGCYKAALKASGVRAVGQGVLSLSIDDTGRVRGAVLRPSFALGPAAVRCIQGSAMGMQLAKSQVEGSGSAEAFLDFRAP